jgi:carbon-monoxide dehydrogenase medium subunit
MMAFRMARPAHLIDINMVAGLDRVAVTDGVLSIAACVRHAAFHRPVTPGPTGELLAQVVAHIAHYPIRQRGTFCGSLAHSDPASEWCLTAATLDAEMIAMSRRGRRAMAAVDYFQGIMTTALEDDEFLVEARVPLLPPTARFGFYEFSRRAGDYAIAAALATFRLEDGRIVDPRLGVGGVETFPRRIAEAESALTGRPAERATFAAAAEAAAAAVEPMEDVHADAEYRRDLVRAVVQRALERAAL